MLDYRIALVSRLAPWFARDPGRATPQNPRRSSLNVFGRHVTRLCSTVALLGMVFGASPAFAQGGGPGKAAAEALFREAKELTDTGDFEAACDKFSASQELDPTIGTMLHLADCYDQVGRTASAWALFREAAGLARSQQQEQRATIAEQRAAELDSRLTHVTIAVADSKVAGLEVSLGAIVVPRALWGTQMPVDPGEATLQASAPGYITWEIALKLVDGETATVEIPKLKAQPTPPKPERPEALPASVPAAPQAEDSNVLTITAWSLSGAGALALVGGALLGYRAYTLNENSMSECRPDQPNLCSPQGRTLRDDAGTAADWSTVALAAGGVMVTTGVVLLLTGNKSSKDPMIDANKSKQPEVAVALDPALRFGTIGVRGVW